MINRTRRRIGTVVLAPAAALLAWAFIRVTGVDLVVSTGDGVVGPGDVFAAALVAALAGWAAVALLERWSTRPRSRWTWLASTALAVSVIGPSWFADGASAVCLIALHVVTAVVVIGGFAATLPFHGESAGMKAVPGTMKP
jgi:Family of unknown function (DUF6069)